MRIAIIGAGKVGTALGAGWGRTGHEIVYGVRDPTASNTADLPPTGKAEVALPGDAAATAETIVLALPWHAAEAAAGTLGDVAGKTVIDCMNPLAMVDGKLELALGYTTSGAETLASCLPAARIVKTLNQVGAEVMAETAGLRLRPVMFVAADDPAAKATAIGLVDDLGFDGRDAGALKKARLLEPLAMLWISQAFEHSAGREWGFAVAERGA